MFKAFGEKGKIYKKGPRYLGGISNVLGNDI